jgi:hypothetical protein
MYRVQYVSHCAGRKEDVAIRSEGQRSMNSGTRPKSCSGTFQNTSSGVDRIAARCAIPALSRSSGVMILDLQALSLLFDPSHTIGDFLYCRYVLFCMCSLQGFANINRNRAQLSLSSGLGGFTARIARVMVEPHFSVLHPDRQKG